MGVVSRALVLIGAVPIIYRVRLSQPGLCRYMYDERREDGADDEPGGDA